MKNTIWTVPLATLVFGSGTMTSYAEESDLPIIFGDCDQAQQMCQEAASEYSLSRCQALANGGETAFPGWTCKILRWSPAMCFPCDPRPIPSTCIIECTSPEGRSIFYSSGREMIQRLIEELELGKEEEETGHWRSTGNIDLDRPASCPSLSQPCSPLGKTCWRRPGGASPVSIEYACQ